MGKHMEYFIQKNEDTIRAKKIIIEKIKSGKTQFKKNGFLRFGVDTTNLGYADVSLEWVEGLVEVYFEEKCEVKAERCLLRHWNCFITISKKEI